jgi:hypothetical protein
MQCAGAHCDIPFRYRDLRGIPEVVQVKLLRVASPRVSARNSGGTGFIEAQTKWKKYKSNGAPKRTTYSKYPEVLYSTVQYAPA